MMFINVNSDFHGDQMNAYANGRVPLDIYARRSVVDDSVIYEFYCLYVGSYLK